MSEQMEKLEGDVARIIYVELRTSGITARRVAKELIALTLKAVVDGKVKLPGEEWRGDLCLAEDTSGKTIITYLAVDGEALGEPLGGPYRLIALSPTGEEE